MVLGIVERDIRYAEEIRQYLTEIEKYKQALRPSKIRNDPIASRQLQQRIAELLEMLRELKEKLDSLPPPPKPSTPPESPKPEPKPGNSLS